MGLPHASRRSTMSSVSVPPLPVLQVRSPEPQADQLRGALAADPPLEPTEAFLAELQQQSVELESASPQEILRYAVERFAPRFTMATAFCTEGI